MTSRAHSEPRHLRVVAGNAKSEPPLSDAELIDAFERGDSRTAELLYDRLCNVVNATLVKVLGRRGPDHDDLAQTAFEQILLTLARRKFARACKLTSWAVSVTTNVALNAMRKRKSERRYFDTDTTGEDAAAKPSLREGPEQRALMAQLRRELAELPELTAAVIVMHDMMGHDLAEISVLTGLSVAAAQSRLVRGRADLRERLVAAQEGAQ